VDCGPKQESNIAAHVIDARSGDVRAVFGLRHYERALQHRLDVKREALCRSIDANAAKFRGFGDITGKSCRRTAHTHDSMRVLILHSTVPVRCDMTLASMNC
jgi:hypothetical protein